MDRERFELEKKENIKRQATDVKLRNTARDFILQQFEHNYTYNFTWLGMPIIQFPQDIISLQEIIWKVKPDVIIETGIARGGSIIFHSSMQRLIGNNGIVIGIDIDIRSHNREAIENHPFANHVYLIEGDSTSFEVMDQVKELISGGKSVLVILDSNHTHDHVLKELEVFSPLVTNGSYLVVLDTIVEDMPDHFFKDRPWRAGNSPKSAVKQFLKENKRFTVDRDIEDKLLITVAPEGYLKCVSD
ncbi:cephalosporin hydroxylase family protein [Paenibacillus polymyxa]|uniref:Cephalosporin hydroxylase n=1 Tax=Paenibacillus polymyxa (strain SC2) TaxID=886882 RepID=E3EBM4_PAEPS|nr:CmcI family methyltransferase [Paenibacillus polymyxa]ADO58842.1 cephalosporin hydroxylase [Paenibacillus polymyxa SC2]WPQ56447.1 CmcI family methyltransferase [Paenibacillus polymyxa]CCI71373.1 Rhamnosyl O-methyltransferase, cephalosporin hydroxylase [Paenibacillus polymyxa M1]